MNKKLLALILAGAMTLGLTACGGSQEQSPAETGDDSSAPERSGATYTVGICQYAPHNALDAATQGFKDALTEKLGEGNVTFNEQNANGDSPTCSTIINGFVSSNVDLILANATAVKMYNESVCQQLGLTMPEDYSPIAAD